MSKIFNSFKNNIAFNPFKKDAAENAVKSGVDATGEIKETVLRRMKNYVTLVLNDYKHVAKESLIHMKVKDFFYCILRLLSQQKIYFKDFFNLK